MKIIFLDVDGVLNSDSDYYYTTGPNKGDPRARAPHCGTYATGVYRGISDKKVKRLAKIVEETSASIVLVSSWKKCYVKFLETGRDVFGRYLYNKLTKQGLKILDTTYEYEKIHDVRGDYTVWKRGMGVYHWLKEHDNVESWIALDDETWDYRHDQIGRVIKTLDFEEPEGGLNDRIMKKAIEMLNNPEKMDFEEEAE